MDNISDQLKTHRLAIELRKSRPKPNAFDADVLADRLVKEFNNPNYKKWYYQVIYDLGIPKVLELHRRALEGNQPAKLFTRLANEARGYNGRSKS